MNPSPMYPGVRASEAFQVIRGVTYDKLDAKAVPHAGYIPILRAGNIAEGRLDLNEDLVYLPTDNVKPEQVLRPSDIVMATSSGSLSVVGKTAQLRSDWFGSFGAFCACLRPKPGWNASFVAYVLQSSAIRRLLSERASGVNINNLRREHIESLTIPRPPTNDQDRIVAAIEAHFSCLDAAEQGLKRVQTKLKHARASVLKAAVEGRLVPTEAALARAEGRRYQPASALLARVLAERRARWAERGERGKYKEPVAPETEGLPELPDGWVWASMDQLAWSSGYGTSVKCSAESEGPAVLRIPNVQGGHIDLGDLKFATKPDELSTEGAVDPGDLLFVRTNGSLRLIGLGCAVTEPLPIRAWFASYLIRLRLCGSTVMWSWIGQVWNGPVVRNYIERDAASSAGQFNVSLSAATRYAVPLPPLAEQARIVAEVDRRLSVLDQVEALVGRSLTRCASLRQSILKRAFEGRLVPPSAEVTPE